MPKFKNGTMGVKVSIPHELWVKIPAKLNLSELLRNALAKELNMKEEDYIV